MARRRRWSFFMPALEHAPILWLDDLHRGRLTAGGRMFFWGVVMCGTLLLGGITAPLLTCFCFSASALLLAWMAGWFYRPRLRLSRRIATSPSAGEVFAYEVTVENLGRRAVCNLFVEERGLPADLRPVGDAEPLVVLEPGETAVVTLRLRCLRRGAFELGRLQGAVSLPSGLYKAGRAHRICDRLLVYPRMTPLESFDLPAVRNYQPGGISVASHVGESTEFFGTRDWRQGDRVRDIHWPSSARAGRLIAREFQEEYFARLAMVLDVEVRRAGDEALLERAISLAAGITAVLARRDYIIDIFAAGPRVYHFQAGRALAHLDNILDILACLEAGDRLDVAELESVLVPEAACLSAIVFVMLDWDPARAGVVQHLKSLGVAVRVISLRKQRPPTGLAAHEVVEIPQ